MWHRCRGRHRRTNDVGVEDLPPGVGIGIDQADQWTDGRGVDEVVDAAERLGGRGDSRSARRLVGDVAFQGNGTGAGFVGSGLGSLEPPREQRDVVAALRKSDADTAPQAARIEAPMTTVFDIAASYPKR
ncbi:hypothetical protein LAUMK15_03735 [Mycobacterium persicum]|nr:hypothetical protein LAUMK15_03735 [Mycobacterium persicum]